MQRRRATATAVLAAIITALSGAAAQAAPGGSIVYIRAGNVWLASPDAGQGYQVTFDGGWYSPSEADDGTIMAMKGRQMYRMNPSGQLLNPPFDGLYTGESSTFKGPFDARISPDGTREAYWGGYDNTYSEPPVNYYSWEVSTIWGPSDRFEMPGGQVLGQQDYSQPSWIDNTRLLMSNVATASIAQVAVEDTALGGDNSEVQWFSDPEAGGLEEGTIARDLSKVAFVADTEGLGSRDQVRLYSIDAGVPSGVPGDPVPSAPAPRCALTGAFGGEFAGPTLSPDGRYLAWAEGDGIHTAPVGDLADCSSITPSLVLPGGAEPAWGAAPVNPAAAPKPPAGGGPTPSPAPGPGTTPPPPEHPVPITHKKRRCPLKRVHRGHHWIRVRVCPRKKRHTPSHR